MEILRANQYILKLLFVKILEKHSDVAVHATCGLRHLQYSNFILSHLQIPLVIFLSANLCTIVFLSISSVCSSHDLISLHLIIQTGSLNKISRAFTLIFPAHIYAKRFLFVCIFNSTIVHQTATDFVR